MISRWSSAFQIAALCVLAFAPFANTFNNPFLYDDIAYVLENPHVKNPPSSGEILFSPYPPQMASLALYRPLVTLSYISDRALWGADVRGYHFTNVLMHAIATLLLYFSARSLAPGSPLAFFAAALFAVQPIHTESVAWVVGRAEVGSAAFLLLTFYLYLIALPLSGARRVLAGMGSILSFFAGLLTKETAAVLIAIIVLYNLLWGPGRGGRHQLRRLALRCLPYLGALLAYLAMRVYSLPSFGPGPEGQYFKGVGLYARALTMLKGLLYYVKLCILPGNYSVDYDFYISISTSLFDASLAPALIVTAVLLVLAWKMARRDRVITFSVGFFLITLAPVSNLVPIGVLLAERLLYLPSAAFALALGGILAKFQKAGPSSEQGFGYRRAAIILFIAILGLYAASSLKRNTYWRDEFSLWSKTVQSNPRSLRSLQKLGDAYKQKGMQDKAMAQFFIALGHKSKFKQTYNNLGNVFNEKGLLQRAFYFYNEALTLDPAYADAANNLGITLKKASLKDKAIAQYKTAIGLSPAFAAAHKNLAIALMEARQYSKALGHLKETLRLDPFQDEAAAIRQVMAELGKMVGGQ